MSKREKKHGDMPRERYVSLLKILIAKDHELAVAIDDLSKRRAGHAGSMSEDESASRNSARAVDEGLLEMKALERAQIQGALGRLERGKYGYCIDCEEEILAKRLVALPYAIRCNDCEEAAERSRKK